MSDQDIPFRYIYFIKNRVSNKWRDLAGFLAFDTPTINNIAGRNIDDISRCEDMLGEWRLRKGPDATMGVLMEALTDAELEGIVKGLKKKYPGLADGAGAGKRTGGSGKRRITGSRSKPVVLMLNDEYGTRKGGISTIHRGMARLLVSKGAEVYSTVLEATEEDKNDAATDGVQLIVPATFPGDPRQPELNWLTWDHQSRYPKLPPNIGFIIGHVNLTSRAARMIREQRLPDAKLVQVTHVIPEDVSHYKSDAKVLTIGDENDSILEDLKHADVIFSVGPLMYDYYKSQTRQLKPHFEFLPEPSNVFSTTEMTYVDTEMKVVLSISRVKGVERLKGYDLVAKSMGIVFDRLPHTKWRARGVTAEDFPESKAIIQANEKKGKFTPLKYGTQEDLSKDMQQAHVVLMPSRAEPFGLVGLEAIAAGVPVLVSHKSGLAWFLRSQDPDFDRLIVEIEDDDEEAAKTLAKRIVKILTDGHREFQAARKLKEKLLTSKYWEASHRQFLDAFGL
uniref:Death domain-containing protein n=1 Tax=Branchiostoma floridae TaxID=7739 RepID=C3ZA45_BRAFL|eukprot:XP_002594622.1 hypothetical protein BRAFLDRAFT_77601 [Branchiostoma floridae]